MSHQTHANKTYLHIHTVLATLSSSIYINWQIQRSSATRMKPSACQKGGSIYINYFNKKIYIYTPFFVSLFFWQLVVLGFALLIRSTGH